MGSSNIKSIEVLDELNNQITYFVNLMGNQMQQIQQEIKSVLDWISEREIYWQKQVTSLTESLIRAERDLARCIAIPSDENGYKPSCYSEITTVRKLKQELGKAKQEQLRVRQWKEKISNNLSRYIGEATRVQRVTNSTMGQATKFLNKKYRDLDQYKRIKPPDELNIIGQRGSDFVRARQNMLMNALDDRLVGRDIKGWIRNELRRINNVRRAERDPMLRQQIIDNQGHLYNTRIRMPPGVEAGHRIHDIHHWSNLRFEEAFLNRGRMQRAARFGLDDRVR